MIYDELGNTGIRVSKICLGTMTWGEQNDETEAFAQLDLALDRGVNFMDTAEMYPVPARQETYSRTESIIGNWLKNSGKRNQIVLATKAAGPAPWLSYVRENPDFSSGQLVRAVEASLKRLQTDYIDLYQLHWPERSTNFFGKLGYRHENQATGTPFTEILETLQRLVEAGKIRHIGVSNETPWGLAEFHRLASVHGLPHMVSIQNPYNLLNRTFEIGLAEMAIRNRTGLLAYSPLGFGVLTGKYLNAANPEGARITRFPRFSRYSGPNAVRATAHYVSLAKAVGISPARMALAYVHTRPFVTATLIGATGMDQLTENLDSINLTLTEDVLEAIETIHRDIPNPAP